MKKESILLPLLFLILLCTLIFATAPNLTFIFLNTTSITNDTNQNLTTSFGTFDLDGDDIKVIYNWYKNQASIQVLNMPFENTTLNMSASTKDYTSLNNSATVFSATWGPFSGYDGKGAYSFDGIDDYIDLGDPSDTSLDFAGNFSIEAWINFSSLPGVEAMIFSKVGDSGAGYYFAIDSTGKLKGVIVGGSTATAQSSMSLNNGKWQHVMMVRTDNKVDLYINGSLDGTNTAPAQIGNVGSSLHAMIGLSSHSVTRYFTGQIDDVKIYNLSLSSSQINELYKNNTNLITSELTSPNQIWNISGTPNDGTTDGTTKYSTGVSITDPYIDLELTNLWFSTDSPVERETVTIYTNITNLGGLNSGSFITTFKNGTTEIGNISTSINLQTKSLISINWTIPIGTSNVSVSVNPNNSVSETNNNNNFDSELITVGSYHIYYGNITGKLRLAGGNDELISFNPTLVNVFVFDSDISINFNSLQAIGRKKDGTIASSDFVDIDLGLGTSSFSDNITNLYSDGGTFPKSSLSYKINGAVINNVPIINSTNNNIFLTGILWDTSDDDGNNEYDSISKEDLVFVSKINQSQQGQYDITDFEIKVPSFLRNYKNGAETIDIYIDLLET